MSPQRTLTLPRIGRLASGLFDSIADVPGVTVGHATVAEGRNQTGVTVIRPTVLDPFLNKVPAAAAIINGFGKSVGLMQLQELGQLETPIALTNTFAVGAVAQAQIVQCVRAHAEVGRSLATVNPLVLECNDGYLNDIQNLLIGATHYEQALAAASHHVPQGSVGAGRGMSCFQLKGGIGSASRRGAQYTVGALVLANFGLRDQLIWAGEPLGERLLATQPAQPARSQPSTEKGSIIMVLATDAPLDSRQLSRLAWRGAAGLARTGSVYGHGSGDVALAFSTAYTLPYSPEHSMPAVAMLHESLLDGLFQSAADSVEQAIVHALWHAESVTGRDGHHRTSLRQLLEHAPR